MLNNILLEYFLIFTWSGSFVDTVAGCEWVATSISMLKKTLIILITIVKYNLNII